VAAASLAVLKARLDGALSTLGWWKMSLLMAEGLEPVDLQGPFQPKPCCDSVPVTVWICHGRALQPTALQEISPPGELPGDEVSRWDRNSLDECWGS